MVVAESVTPAPRAAVSGRWAWGVVAMLTAYLALLVGLPATLVVGPLGAAGAPATLLGIACLAWWLVARLDPRCELGRRQWFHLVVFLFLAAMLASYVVGAMRAANPLEVRAADRAVLRLFSGAGVVLLAADGLRNRADLDRLLRRLSLAGGALAAFGMIQFVFGIEVGLLIKVPGLVTNAAPPLIQERANFRRVSGTASHPIEFGVVLSMVLPIALHCAFTAREHRRRYVLAAAGIAAAIPMSISRAAILGVGVAWVVLVLGWDFRRRVNALIITPIALVAMRVAIPGLMGTIKSLFSGLARDPSYLSRTTDYEYVQHFVTEAPWLGRGIGTFLPELYTTLDNQYLAQLVETGYVGLGVLILLLASGLLMALRVRRHAPDEEIRSMALSLSASALIPIVTFIAFDGLGFPVVFGLVTLLLGIVAAAHRILVQGRAVCDVSGPSGDRERLHHHGSWRSDPVRPQGRLKWGVMLEARRFPATAHPSDPTWPMATTSAPWRG